MNLSVSTLFFELALIFIPGFIWMKIHSRYGFKGEKTQFDLILNAFIFGVVSYTVLYLIYRLNGWPLKLFDLDVDSKRLLQPELFPEILFAVAISIVGGVLTLYFENHKLFTRFVQTIGATKTYGDEDVWDFVFNSSSSAVNFVHFRDFDQRVTYAGFVEVFSESGQLREIVLQDVIVYDFEQTEMYRVPRLYLARARENIHIEFPLNS
ncbi:MAG TPA: DUF6338 family protein [Bradyrhizobium sp.]|nr:DUF6338 family protein [Bradyrhizobium sp.]